MINDHQGIFSNLNILYFHIFIYYNGIYSNFSSVYTLKRASPLGLEQNQLIILPWYREQQSQ
jgi:hypothetical protein